MKFQERAIRLASALALAALIASQIPMRGQTALGSVQQPQDGYLNPNGDNSGSFLGIRGFSNRDVINGLGFTLIGLGAYSALKDARNVGAAVGNAGGSAVGVPEVAKGVTTGDSESSLYNVMRSSSRDFSELIKLIDDAGLATALRTQGPFTFFAPTNMALMVADTTKLRQPENRAMLVSLLKNHLVKGNYTISDLLAMKNGTALETAGGESLIVRNQNGLLSVNNVTVVQNDMAASNGWIHPIEVLIGQP